MDRYFWVPITGACPESNKVVTVHVKFVEIAGIDGYKHLANKCTYKPEDGCSQEECPLFKNVYRHLR